ncbi:MAG: rod shape-determining protein MreD [Marinovum sp.]|nr:rod shape-determining protein MreD [Marinovum sp.]
MADGIASRLWGMRLAYLGLAVFIVFCQLVPIETVPRNWAAPDFLLALTFAWSLRRPDYVPLFSIALAMLFADMMLDRPPGLMAALTVLVCASLQRRVFRVRDEGFATELLLVAVSIALVIVGSRVILTVLFVPTPPLGLTLFMGVMTLAAYPIVVFLSHLVLGVRAQAPGQDVVGRSLT